MRATAKIICTGILLMTFGAQATPEVCRPNDASLSLQLLRRLSLDLRNRVPTMAEIERVVTDGRVADALIDEMLASEEFVRAMLRYHRDLVGLGMRFEFAAPNFILTELAGPLLIFDRTDDYRGQYGLPCLDEQQRLFDASGRPIPIRVDTTSGTRQEGWVKVHPYWAPDQEIRVCAFDAMEHLTGGNDQACNTPNAPADCGCGPNLRFCQLTQYLDNNQYGADTNQVIVDSMVEQVERLIRSVLHADRPYTDLLLSDTIEINGPLSHYLRYQTQTTDFEYWGGTASDQAYQVPTIPFVRKSDWQRTNWRSDERKKLYASLLTTPWFLLKNGTNRARYKEAKRIIKNEEFTPSPSALPDGNDPCFREPDIKKRCATFCGYCHGAPQFLDHGAAYWGKWAEAGIAPIDDAARFPTTLNTALVAACRQTPNWLERQFCYRFYLINPGPGEESEIGKRLAYVFADDVMKDNIERGPRVFAQSAIDDESFARATVAHLSTYLLGPGALGNSTLQKRLTRAFVQSGYDFRAVVRAIVTDANYQPAGLGATDAD